MANLKLSPPWNTFVNELKALFGEDPDVKIDYKDGSYEVRLYVAGDEKAQALNELLPPERVFGNVAFKIYVIPANDGSNDYATTFEKAFKGNPVLKEVLRVSTPFGEYDYAVFRKEVVQFYNDDLTDPHGNESTLFENIARDVFSNAGVYFCTDVFAEGEKIQF